VKYGQRSIQPYASPNHVRTTIACIGIKTRLS
jgi:hypothetical protein